MSNWDDMKKFNITYDGKHFLKKEAFVWMEDQSQASVFTLDDLKKGIAGIDNRGLWAIPL